MKRLDTDSARVAVGAAGGIVVVRSSVSALSAQFLGQLRALCEGAVSVAVRVVRAAGFVMSAVRSVTTFGSDLLELVLGKVGEVGWVGGCHCEGCMLSRNCGRLFRVGCKKAS